MSNFTATCNNCDFSGSMIALNAHDCAHESYLRDAGNNGRCEDFPACGHTDGGSCHATAEGTSEYWDDLYASANRQGISADELDMMMDYGDY